MLIAERSAAFAAVKAKLTAIIDDRAGFAAATIKGDITDADILAVVDAALAAAAVARAKAQAAAPAKPSAAPAATPPQ